MRSAHRIPPCLTLALAALGLLALAPTTWADTRPHAGMMRYPDVSASHIVFSYANDLWLVPRAGGTAIPLASPDGQELVPRFSPDGQTIAFVGNYDGNRDIYTIPLNGGQPLRVTHHPAGEFLCDWTQDGRLIFHAGGLGLYPRATELYSVAALGGMPEKMPVPYGAMGAVNKTGEWLAYTPHSRESRTWKRYRGGMATDIWLFHLKDHVSRKITDWEGTDALPMWHDEAIYYLSDADENHRLNIWTYITGTGTRTQVTHFKEFDVKWPAMGPGPDGRGEIVFQNGSDLYLLDLQTGKARIVEVSIPGDRPKLRPQTHDVKDRIDGWDVSPSGKRAVLEARGDIWTTPVEHGPARNLTRTDGVAERSPSWSPDKKWIAYLSDATGEYEFYITQSDGKGETRQLTSDGQRFRYGANWSPDSKRFVFSDNSGALYLHTLEGDETRLVDEDPWGRPLDANWSHDSNWLTYAKAGDNTQRAIWLYNVESGEKHQVTSGFFSDFSPTFDRKGEYLFYASARSFDGPIYEDVGSSFVYVGTHLLLAVPLKADTKYPWAPESDEETWDDKDEDAEKDKDQKDKDKKDKEGDQDAQDGSPADEDQDADENNKDEKKDKADDDGVSGVWEGTVKGGEQLPPEGLPFTLTLRLSNGSVKGTMSAGPYTGNISDGSYDAATGELNFDMEVTTEDGAETFAVAAKIEDGSISGTVTGEDFAATFSGTRTSTDVPEEEAEKEDKDADKKVEIDLDGFEQRGLALPVARGHFGGLSVNDKNQLIYVSRGVPGSGKSTAIKLFDMEDDKREEKTVVSGAGSYAMTPDGKKLLVRTGGSFALIDAKAGQKLDKKMPLKGLRATIDPRNEWRQVFTDAWRVQREFFYAANMHGVDWEGVRKRYAKMLDDCASRDDVSYVIGEMIAELNVGHAYYFGGGTDHAPSVSVGMLGCDFELHDGAYRISRICAGAPWDSDARGPLSQPGVDVAVGDYLLAVNQIPLDMSKDPWAAFQGMAGHTVTLTVSQKSVIDDEAREVILDLMDGDGGLRYRAWVEHNRAYVEEKSGGKVGYIYVPDTGGNGQRELFRQFYGQRDKAALIIDERWNGGGQIPSRFIELLNRPLSNYWTRRHGRPSPSPDDAHHGPKCMLINGLAGSGGDCFPYYFRFAGLGKLIGTRTWGGLVGISGNPRLIDGGYTSAPTFAFYETDGTWGIEGHGVDPDIEVIDDPALMVEGGDPQLDAAIEHMLAEIERNPYVPTPRPDFPDRSGMGIREQDK
ncbi:MAG: PDZ domain-containing protein [Planctomycetes bacterium]|nr:PDZ domain-containing protein [Planctomycetota bacterium]